MPFVSQLIGKPVTDIDGNRVGHLRDIMDQQIIDVNDVRVVRVNDVELARVNGSFYVANVDTGSNGLLLPLTLVVMVVLVNDRNLLGERYVNRRFLNTVSIAVIAILCILSVLMLVTTI